MTNLEQEAVNADKVLEQIIVISDKGRAEFYAVGGVEPEGGWDAAGEALWTKTTETKAAERKALEDELEALAQAHAARFAPLAPAAGAAAGGAASTLIEAAVRREQQSCLWQRQALTFNHATNKVQYMQTWFGCPSLIAHRESPLRQKSQ